VSIARQVLAQFAAAGAAEVDLVAEVRGLRDEVRALRRAGVSGEALALPVEAAAELLGCGRTQVFALLKAGKLRPAHGQGRRKMISRDSIEALVRADDPRRAHAKRKAPPTAAEVGAWGDEIRRLQVPKPADRQGEPAEAAT
jgi:hypothetical protein